MNVIILAGGLGKRMNSNIPKVCHKINDIPMIIRILKEAHKLNPNHIMIVVGKYKDIIHRTLSTYDQLHNIIFCIQEPALGTGHAIQCCRNQLLTIDPLSQILILSGDIPLITYNTINKFIDSNITNNVRIMTTILEEPTGNGRIIRDNNIFEKIVEEKDCNNEERRIKEVNCGIYLFKNELLCKYLPYLKNNNAQQEYYLTDIIEIIKNNEHINIDIYELPIDSQIELTNVNTQEQKDLINSSK